jgi:hypothetical protein
MQTIVGPYADVEAAYRRERIIAEYGHGTRRHHPVRALTHAWRHHQHHRDEAA